MRMYVFVCACSWIFMSVCQGATFGKYKGGLDAVREGDCGLAWSCFSPPGLVWFGSECDCHYRDHKETTIIRT